MSLGTTLRVALAERGEAIELDQSPKEEKKQSNLELEEEICQSSTSIEKALSNCHILLDGKPSYDSERVFIYDHGDGKIRVFINHKEPKRFIHRGVNDIYILDGISLKEGRPPKHKVYAIKAISSRYPSPQIERQPIDSIGAGVETVKQLEERLGYDPKIFKHYIKVPFGHDLLRPTYVTSYYPERSLDRFIEREFNGASKKDQDENSLIQLRYFAAIINVIKVFADYGVFFFDLKHSNFLVDKERGKVKLHDHEGLKMFPPLDPSKSPDENIQSLLKEVDVRTPIMVTKDFFPKYGVKMYEEAIAFLKLMKDGKFTKEELPRLEIVLEEVPKIQSFVVGVAIVELMTRLFNPEQEDERAKIFQYEMDYINGCKTPGYILGVRPRALDQKLQEMGYQGLMGDNYHRLLALFVDMMSLDGLHPSEVKSRFTLIHQAIIGARNPPK